MCCKPILMDDGQEYLKHLTFTSKYLFHLLLMHQPAHFCTCCAYHCLLFFSRASSLCKESEACEHSKACTWQSALSCKAAESQKHNTSEHIKKNEKSVPAAG